MEQWPNVPVAIAAPDESVRSTAPAPMFVNFPDDEPDRARETHSLEGEWKPTVEPPARPTTLPD